MTSRERSRPTHESTSKNMENIMDTFRMMAYAMRDQAAAANRMMESVKRQVGENPGKNPKGAGVSLLNFKKRILRIS